MNEQLLGEKGSEKRLQNTMLLQQYIQTAILIFILGTIIGLIIYL